MSKRFLPFVCGVGLSLLPVNSGIIAAEAAPGSKEVIRLEDIPAQLASLDDLTLKNVAAFLAAVETEAAAKHISELEAGELRWTAHSISPPLNGDVKLLLSTAYVPADNDPLAKAEKDLASEIDAASSRRKGLVSLATVEMRKRIRNIVIHSTKAEQVAPATQLLRGLAETARQHASAPAFELNTKIFADGAGFLDTFSTALDAIAYNDANAAEAGVRRIAAFSDAMREIVSTDDAIRQIRAVQAPLIASVEAAQSEMQAALVGRKPAAQVSAALTKLETELRAYNPVGFATKLHAYKALAGLAGDREKADSLNLHQSIQQVRAILTSSTLEEPRKSALQDLLPQWETEKHTVAKQHVENAGKSFGARLSEVTQPSDLEALATELRQGKPDAPSSKTRGMDSDSPGVLQLASSLSSLAAAWSAENLDFIGGLGDREIGATPDISREFSGLRERIERDILSHHLKAPELTQPPLAKQPLDQALESFIVAAAAKGDWLRVSNVFALQAPVTRAVEEGLRLAGAAASVNSFIIGKNLENAAQWRPAIAAYKQVLRIAAEVSPVKEAAERLKALKKEHPEAFAPPAPPPRDALRD